MQTKSSLSHFRLNDPEHLDLSPSLNKLYCYQKLAPFIYLSTPWFISRQPYQATEIFVTQTCCSWSALCLTLPNIYQLSLIQEMVHVSTRLVSGRWQLVEIFPKFNKDTATQNTRKCENHLETIGRDKIHPIHSFYTEVVRLSPFIHLPLPLSLSFQGHMYRGLTLKSSRWCDAAFFHSETRHSGLPKTERISWYPMSGNVTSCSAAPRPRRWLALCRWPRNLSIKSCDALGPV